MPGKDKGKNQDRKQIVKLQGAVRGSAVRTNAARVNAVSTGAGDAHEERAARLQWVRLLQEAVSEPGLIHAAYSAFHSYSLGNQLAAAFQCRQRGLPLGPINTFQGWKSLGRHVNKGEKALELCIPFIGKVSATKKDDEENAGQGRAGAGPTERGGKKRKAARGSTGAAVARPAVAEAVEEDSGERIIRGFAWRARWFVLAQTSGEEIEAPEVPPALWDKERALRSLDIRQVPFMMPDGNVQGYAREREVAVSPVAALPHKTLFHEIAHVVLGHTALLELSDGEMPEPGLREVEAESVAYLLCATLQLPGVEYSRGYIQHWLQGSEIGEGTARKIFATANQILDAGTK